MSAAGSAGEVCPMGGGRSDVRTAFTICGGERVFCEVVVSGGWVEFYLSGRVGDALCREIARRAGAADCDVDDFLSGWFRKVVSPRPGDGGGSLDVRGRDARGPGEAGGRLAEWNPRVAEEEARRQEEIDLGAIRDMLEEESGLDLGPRSS